MLVVGSGADPNLKIWEYNETYRKWVHVETLHGHTAEIHDVAWAPNIGR
jgi:nucleoporin SEH1